ncbi:MAG: hypothetical protein JO296_07670 [Pseudonocardiales bacterium]|nr:hypothetical protein [Pseudonocardiales bacterium]
MRSSSSTVVVAIVIFVLTTFLTYLAAFTARGRPRGVWYHWLLAWVFGNSFALIIELFAWLYWNIGTPPNFNAELSRIGALHFALGTLTTAGTGTIAPTSDLARALVGVQMIVDLLYIAGALTIAVSRWSEKSC